MLQTHILRESAISLAENVLSSTDVSRTDRLWPADPIAFQTNALNVAYGACGTALFLHDILGALPAEVRTWLLAQPVNVDSYPPGLYSGIAGIAWSYAEMGMIDRGLELFRLVPKSGLAFDAADIFNGCAGWGLASLAFYLRTGQGEFLDLACRAADFLVSTAQQDESGAYWHGQFEGVVPLGFAYGASGIGLFLLYLWRVTDNPRYLSVAREAIDFDVAHAQVRNEMLVWGTTTESEGHRPYWLRGGAGVATALIRFAKVLREPRYLQLARKAVQPCALFFSTAPHLFEGLASMGESLLDMFLLTGESAYLDAARQKAEQTLLYRVNRPVGTAFPGRFLLRISHDYGAGGAGIGLFLHRMSTLGPRRFHDIFPDVGTHSSE